MGVLRGGGRRAGPHPVAVGERTYTAAHVVIATGADPVIPPIAGLRELDGLWTNREVTGMREVPRRVVILGAGSVGGEMAQALVRLRPAGAPGGGGGGGGAPGPPPARGGGRGGGGPPGR